MVRRFKKGFTLAELLIVVAIIAVLAAIAIPVFTSQLETAKQAVDDANLRNAAALAQINVTMTGFVDGESAVSGYYDISSGKIVEWDGYEEISGYNQTEEVYPGTAHFPPLPLSKGTAVILVTTQDATTEGQALAYWYPVSLSAWG